MNHKFYYVSYSYGPHYYILLIEHLNFAYINLPVKWAIIYKNASLYNVDTLNY